MQFHEGQSKHIEGDSDDIVANSHNMPQIVLLALSFPRPPDEIPHHPVDVIRLDYRPEEEQQKGESADDQQFLEDGLAVEIGRQAELIGELRVKLVVVEIFLLAIKQIDVKRERALDHEVGLGLVEQVDGHFDDGPLVVGHREDEDHEDQQVDY